MSICAVIPAAGRGVRLGLAEPKILVPLNDTLTVWSVLRDALIAQVERIAVVLAPSAVPNFESVLATDIARSRVSVAVQEKATGMGDAIFVAWPIWRDFDSIVVVWGDQVNLSPDTLRRALDVHRQSSAGLTIPLVRVANPYVQYIIGSDGRLIRISQTREHETVASNGYSDVGVFALRTTGLYEIWQEYRASCSKGSLTQEINFLPFLVFLVEVGWSMKIVAADCADEARGINTAVDLAFARHRFTHRRSAGA